jgi:hypothetical protein
VHPYYLRGMTDTSKSQRKFLHTDDSIVNR